MRAESRASASRRCGPRRSTLRKVRVSILITLCVLASACGKPGPALAGATDLGALMNPNAPTLWRDGGSSVLLGTQLLWAFGDTIFPFQADDGSQLRTNTAALAAPAAPLTLTEPLDGRGAPYQFVPFTADESASNNTLPTGERIALWPGAMIATDPLHALVFVDKLIVLPGVLNYQEVSTELAQASSGSTQATRLGTLFAAPEPQFNHGAVAKDSVLYLYSCETSGDCRVARASLAAATQRPAYQFWTGASWSSDISLAALDVPGSTAGFSVAWNDALGEYVSASTPGFSSQLLLRTAPAPEGPWSNPTTAWNAPSEIYAVYQHPELELANGRTIRISYSRQVSGFAGEIRLVEINFR